MHDFENWLFALHRSIHTKKLQHDSHDKNDAHTHNTHTHTHTRTPILTNDAEPLFRLDSIADMQQIQDQSRSYSKTIKNPFSHLAAFVLLGCRSCCTRGAALCRTGVWGALDGSLVSGERTGHHVIPWDVGRLRDLLRICWLAVLLSSSTSTLTERSQEMNAAK